MDNLLVLLLSSYIMLVLLICWTFFLRILVYPDSHFVDMYIWSCTWLGGSRVGGALDFISFGLYDEAPIFGIHVDLIWCVDGANWWICWLNLDYRIRICGLLCGLIALVPNSLFCSVCWCKFVFVGAESWKSYFHSYKIWV